MPEYRVEVRWVRYIIAPSGDAAITAALEDLDPEYVSDVDVEADEPDDDG